MRWLAILFCVTALHAAKRIECITSFPLSDLSVQFPKELVEQRSNQRLQGLLDPEVTKVVLMNPCVDLQTLSNFPWRKSILFVWEPVKLPTLYYAHFSRVYTWDDDLIDGKKFFKFYYPSLMPFDPGSVPFQEKKLCATIVSNWTPRRVHIVELFHQNAKQDLAIYGHLRRDLEEPFQEMYRGVIPGGHSGEAKKKVLQQYRFCLCLESTSEYYGYITEKIFNCFAAGCVPIYWGPPNAREYIPRECYIDCADFLSFEELYEYITTMSEETYNQILGHIQRFLQSDEAKIFSPESFEQLFLEAIRS